MTYDSILLRYGEIFLKGKNQPLFEQRLINNIQILVGLKKVQKSRGRLILPYFQDHQKLKKVFGLTSYSPAVQVKKELEAIKQKTVELFQDKKGTFRVETKRSDKRFPLTSPEINQEIGQELEKHTSLKFAFEHYDFLLEIEINDQGAYLFWETFPCFGGLPVGSEGKVALLLENEMSILSGLLMMKRGCALRAIAVQGENKEFNINLLQQFSPIKLEIQFVNDLNNFELIVSGQDFDHYQQYTFNGLVLRPLIAYSEEEIRKGLFNYQQI